MMKHSWRSLLNTSTRFCVVGLGAVLASAVLLWTSVLPAADAPTAPFVAKTLRPFLEQHCVDCHDAKTKKGGLDLEKLSTDFKDLAAFKSWVKVLDRVQSGEMPPKARKQRPDKAEAQTVLQVLQAVLTDAERSHRSGS